MWREGQRRILVGAEAAGQQVRLRVRVGLFLGDLAFVDQPLHERVVDACGSPCRRRGSGRRANRRRASTSHSRAGPIRNAAIVLCGSSSAVIAVSLIIRCASMHELLQHLGRRRPCSGAKRSKSWLAGEDHLVGRLAAAALAAHAVGQHRQRAAGHARVHDDLDLVLLVGAVAAVHAGGGGEAIACGRCAHDRKL